MIESCVVTKSRETASFLQPPSVAIATDPELLHLTMLQEKLEMGSVLSIFP